jgi:molecular chaperone GrpE
MLKKKMLRPDEDGQGETAAEAAEETAELDPMQQELEKAQAQAEEYLNLAQRVQADFDNFRRRNASVRADAYEDGAKDMIKLVLPVIDNLERALAYSEGETLTEGVKMTLKQFEDTMERLGMKAYGERGDEFDPKIHNAIMQTEDPELGENRIAAVLQKGYCKGEKIIRHAMVTVTG